jgi:hypothetical protein
MRRMRRMRRMWRMWRMRREGINDKIKKKRKVRNDKMMLYIKD